MKPPRAAVCGTLVLPPPSGGAILKRTIKILLSLAFLALIAWSLRDQNPWEVIRRLDPAYAAASLVVTCCMVTVSCWKWKVLLELESAPVPFPRLFRFYLIGYYYTVLLPSNVGGDVMRAYLAGRETGSHSKAVVSVFLERITGLMVLLLLASTAPLLQPGLIRNPAVFVPVAAAGGMLVCLLAGAALPDPLRWMPSLFTRFLKGWHPEHPRGWLARTADRFMHALHKLRARLLSALRELDQSTSAKPAVILLTTLFYALTWVNIWVTFRAFGEPVPFQGILAVAPVCMIIACLPVAPFAGLGLTEGSYMYFFGLLGVGGPATLAMALFLRMKLILVGFAGMLCQIPGTSKPEAP